MTTKAKIKKVSQGTVKLIRLAKHFGVPSDSLKRFLTAGYIPQPKQLEFHAAARAADLFENANEIGFGGARGGSKTHTTFAQVALDDCQRYEGLKILFLRKVGKAATEAIEDLRLSVLFQTPHKFKVQKSTIIFPNKSKIIVGHFANENDIDNYLGLEYDIIVVEEATQLSKSKIEKIKTCLRSSKVYDDIPFRPRIYYTTNPGGIGHQWFKEKFITPFRNGTEKLTKFIQALAKDNKKLNKEYIKTVLEPLTGWLRKAWLEGDWDVFAGQFFTNFRYDKHVFNPKHLPDKEFIKNPDIEVWTSLDYGNKHWMTSHLFCKYDGIIYVLDELAMRLTLIETYANNFHQWLERWDLNVSDLIGIPAGHDCFAKSGQTGKSHADLFAEHGITLQLANVNREHGAGIILQLLGDEENGIEPRLKISSNCLKLIETLPILEHNPNKPNDVLKIDADDDGIGGDDAYDDFRYGTATDLSLGILI